MSDPKPGTRPDAAPPHPDMPDGGDTSPLVIMELIQRLKVRDVMTRNLVTLTREDTMRRAQELMRIGHFNGVPIAENGRLYGLVSIDDVIRALDGGYIDDMCSEHMSTRLIVLEDDMPISFALRYFENYKYGRFPVLNRDRMLVGVVSQRDINRVLLYELTAEINRLERQITRPPEDGVGDDLYMLREYPVVRHDFENAGKAANEIKRLLRERRVSTHVTRRISVAAYELEINLCIHSDGGTLAIVVSQGVAEIIAKDTGPGIEDVEWACRDGTSTANDWIRSLGFGAGMGLANTKRVSDHFDIQSTVGKGTTIRCKFNLKPAEENQEPAP
ncbi:MAG: CBS domain-containing protein [Kiritimatiellia bacterium]|jgi:CBS domain-containing protein/anti-sigma regulatory factor (Ser/Thr protein kinase)